MQVVDTLHHQAKVEALVASDKFIISGGTDNTIKVGLYGKITCIDLELEEENNTMNILFISWKVESVVLM